MAQKRKVSEALLAGMTGARKDRRRTFGGRMNWVVECVFWVDVIVAGRDSLRCEGFYELGVAQV